MNKLSTGDLISMVMANTQLLSLYTEKLRLDLPYEQKNYEQLREVVKRTDRALEAARKLFERMRACTKEDVFEAVLYEMTGDKIRLIELIQPEVLRLPPEILAEQLRLYEQPQTTEHETA